MMVYSRLPAPMPVTSDSPEAKPKDLKQYGLCQEAGFRSLRMAARSSRPLSDHSRWIVAFLPTSPVSSARDEEGK
jgi:hypothetical protein